MVVSPAGRPLAVALDLGSTLIKAGILDARERIVDVRSIPSPSLQGSHGRRETDPMAYCHAADEILERITAQVPAGTALGIACQRSSFLLWNRKTGVPVTPLISWQDRRAAAWCARHEDARDQVAIHSGLRLSPHHAGPKLAAIQEEDPSVGRAIRAGDLLFGTLETFLVWRWLDGREHVTDASMAARTCLFELSAGQWSPWLLELFGVPAEILPAIRHTAGRPILLKNGLALVATVADQAAATLATLREGTHEALINLGTGTFVLRSCAPEDRRAGYLTGCVYGGAGGVARFALEGTINGNGGEGGRNSWPPALPVTDPAPRAFCLPDNAGLGSPHWRPDLSLIFSAGAAGLDHAGRGRLLLEGLLFRIRQILGDLFPDQPPDQVILSGGLARLPVLNAGLATLLGRPVLGLTQAEQTLHGTARLAAGLDLHGHAMGRTSYPAPEGAYLDAKYQAWRSWLSTLL